LVDATDLKSVEIFLVPVRVRPWAPDLLIDKTDLCLLYERL